MNPNEFFKLNLRPGDRVQVRLGSSNAVEAFFDGYKTFGNHILRDPQYDLFPVFRAVSKNGKMLPQSPWEGHSTGEGFSSITSCRKIESANVPATPNGIPVNPPGNEETVEILLSDTSFPKAFQAKLDELMEQNAFPSKEEAIRYLRTTPIVLELYYEKDNGLFAVETDALDACPEDIKSPYTGTPFTEENI